MGDLTQNFSRSEFRCKGKNCCSGTAVIVPLLPTSLQALRNETETHQRLQSYTAEKYWRLALSSGFRCLTHNNRPVAEGGAGSNSNSTHPKGEGTDAQTPLEMTVDQFAILAERIEAFRHGGIGKYSWGLHLDVRASGPARWDYR